MQSPKLNLANYIKQQNIPHCKFTPVDIHIKLLLGQWLTNMFCLEEVCYFNVKARRLAAKCKCPFSFIYLCTDFSFLALF